jgi:hypothetical protein
VHADVGARLLGLCLAVHDLESACSCVMSSHAEGSRLLPQQASKCLQAAAEYGHIPLAELAFAELVANTRSAESSELHAPPDDAVNALLTAYSNGDDVLSAVRLVQIMYLMDPTFVFSKNSRECLISAFNVIQNRAFLVAREGSMPRDAASGGASEMVSPMQHSAELPMPELSLSTAALSDEDDISANDDAKRSDDDLLLDDSPVPATSLDVDALRSFVDASGLDSGHQGQSRREAALNQTTEQSSAAATESSVSAVESRHGDSSTVDVSAAASSVAANTRSSTSHLRELLESSEGLLGLGLHLQTPDHLQEDDEDDGVNPEPRRFESAQPGIVDLCACAPGGEYAKKLRDVQQHMFRSGIDGPAAYVDSYQTVMYASICVLCKRGG